MGFNRGLLFGGIAVTVVSIFSAVILYFVFKLKKEKIESLLEKDYGDRF